MADPVAETAPTLASLILEINTAGYYIQNLAQDSEGAWQANLRTQSPLGSESWEFAFGSTPDEALRLCWAKARETRGDFRKPQAKQNYFRGKNILGKDLDVEDLLKGLV